MVIVTTYLMLINNWKRGKKMNSKVGTYDEYGRYIYGIDPTHTGKCAETKLTCCIKNQFTNQIEKMETIIAEKYWLINKKNDDGDTPAIILCRSFHLPMYQKMLDVLLNYDVDLILTDNKNRSAAELIISTINNTYSEKRLAVLKKFVSKKLNLNFKVSSGKYFLSHVCYNDNCNNGMLDYLLLNKIKLDLQVYEESLINYLSNKHNCIAIDKLMLLLEFADTDISSLYNIFESYIINHCDKPYFNEILMFLLQKFEGNKLYYNLYQKHCKNITLNETQIRMLNGISSV